MNSKAEAGATADGVRVLSSLGEVAPAEWDALLDKDSTPFVRHGFLEALESSRCAAPKSGWTPRHLTLWRKGQLIAAAPAYQKSDSDGDFSRDWDWASAAARAGLDYYPKLVLTVPFTPCTGRRFLVAPGQDRARCIAKLVAAARELCLEEGISSIHVLFPDSGEAEELERAGLALRCSFQFHWRNEGYQTPDEFLGRFSSKRRNMVRRERAAPARQEIRIHTVRGDELRARNRECADNAFALHRSTVEKLMWGRFWLNQDFYRRVFAALPDQVELVEARNQQGKLVAGAFNLASETRLYGRYWGCFEEHPFLHFNVCLYHSIDDCIARGLQVFEGGAGGEHKLGRGFLPSITWSAHAFLDARLDRAVRDHLLAETAERQRNIERFRADSPILKKEA